MIPPQLRHIHPRGASVVHKLDIGPCLISGNKKIFLPWLTLMTRYLPVSVNHVMCFHPRHNTPGRGGSKLISQAHIPFYRRPNFGDLLATVEDEGQMMLKKFTPLVNASNIQSTCTSLHQDGSLQYNDPLSSTCQKFFENCNYTCHLSLPFQKVRG